MKRKLLIAALVSIVPMFNLICLWQYQVEASVIECQDKSTGYPVVPSCDSAGVLDVELTDAIIATTTLGLTDEIDPANGSIASGATASVTFAATATWFIVENESTGTLRICPACTASSTTGLLLSGGGIAAADGLSINTISFYNSGTSAVTYSILSGRKP